MFAVAYEIARGFTHPLVLSLRKYDGSVTAGIGAMVLVNGTTAITAAHVIAPAIAAKSQAASVNELERALDDLGSTEATKGKRKKLLRKYDAANLVTNVSLWPGFDGVRLVRAKTFADADLAILELDGIPADVAERATPTFKKPTEIVMGTSVMKFGYPFHTLESTFDDQIGTFRFADDALPIPIFPMDGIVTRVAEVAAEHDNYPVKLIETSTPGLRGQSGGPVVDRHGVVWGIQSKTHHLQLGFVPSVQHGAKTVEEHQFLNAGLAIHTATLEAILAGEGIEVQWVD